MPVVHNDSVCNQHTHPPPTLITETERRGLEKVNISTTFEGGNLHPSKGFYAKDWSHGQKWVKTKIKYLSCLCCSYYSIN